MEIKTLKPYCLSIDRKKTIYHKIQIKNAVKNDLPALETHTWVEWNIIK